MAKNCSKIKSDGSPCRGYRINGSKFCFAHAPEKARERAKARKLGGLNRRIKRDTDQKPPEVKSAVDLLVLVNAAISDAWKIEKDTERRARVLGYLVTVASRALQVGEMENRLEAIEDQLAILQERQK